MEKPRLPSVSDLAHDLSTDLEAVQRTAEAKRIEDAQREEAMRQVIAYRWDRAMQRAFKGIITRRERLGMLSRATASEEA